MATFDIARQQVAIETVKYQVLDSMLLLNEVQRLNRENQDLRSRLENGFRDEGGHRFRDEAEPFQANLGTWRSYPIAVAITIGW